MNIIMGKHVVVLVFFAASEQAKILVLKRVGSIWLKAYRQQEIDPLSAGWHYIVSSFWHIMVNELVN